MTKHNAHQYLYLVQALADGKTIQLRAGCNNNWADKDDNILFNLDPACYRIKPEPIKQEFYYIVYKENDSNSRGSSQYIYNDLSTAQKYLKEIDPKGEKYVIMHAKASSMSDI